MSNSRRMQELERRLAELMNEKKGLESQNKLLQHTAQLNATHYSELESQQVSGQSRRFSLLFF